MRLRDWAKKEGIAYQTAWRWFKAGKLPVPAIKTASGSILVDERPVSSVCGNAIVHEELAKDLVAVVEIHLRRMRQTPDTE